MTNIDTVRIIFASVIVMNDKTSYNKSKIKKKQKEDSEIVVPNYSPIIDLKHISTEMLAGWSNKILKELTRRMK